MHLGAIRIQYFKSSHKITKHGTKDFFFKVLSLRLFYVIKKINLIHIIYYKFKSSKNIF